MVGPNVYPLVILMGTASLYWVNIFMRLSVPTQKCGLLFHLSQASFVEDDAFWTQYFSKCNIYTKTV